MNAMRPTIRYIAADRHKGIANVQFVVRADSFPFTHFADIPLKLTHIPRILDSRSFNIECRMYIYPHAIHIVKTHD